MASVFDNPVDGVKIPQQARGEMRSFTVEQAQTFVKAAIFPNIQTELPQARFLESFRGFSVVLLASF